MQITAPSVSWLHARYHEEYERKLAQNIAKTEREIDKAYQKAVNKAAAASSTVIKTFWTSVTRPAPLFRKELTASQGVRRIRVRVCRECRLEILGYFKKQE